MLSFMLTWSIAGCQDEYSLDSLLQSRWDCQMEVAGDCCQCQIAKIFEIGCRRSGVGLALNHARANMENCLGTSKLIFTRAHYHHRYSAHCPGVRHANDRSNDKGTVDCAGCHPSLSHPTLKLENIPRSVLERRIRTPPLDARSILHRLDL